jgi:hypothetical protein
MYLPYLPATAFFLSMALPCFEWRTLLAIDTFYTWPRQLSMFAL